MKKPSRPTASLSQPKPFWEEDASAPPPTAEVTRGSDVPIDIDGFRVGPIIGQGGTATVYACTDRRGRALALKVLGSGDVTEARREAKLMSQVKHPSVPRVEHVGQLASGQPFLVMERVDGTALDELLASNGPMPWRAVKPLLLELLDALAALHARGLIHRDVKPANVLVRSSSPSVALVDFGISRQTASGMVAPTTANVVRGTLEYMSPEQLSGQPIDARSDLFSAGVLTFEAACGALPWPTTRPGIGARLQTMHATPKLTRPARIPAAAFTVLQRLLALDPDERPATAHQARAQLAMSR